MSDRKYEEPTPLDETIFAPRSLNLDMDGLSMDEWTRLGSNLKQLNECGPFWYGDWMNLGEDQWGAEVYQAFDALTVKDSTLATYARVMSKIKPDDRREELGWTHHKHIADLDLVKDRRKALKLAVEEGWTTDETLKYVQEQNREEPEDKEKGETTSISYDFGYNVAPGDEQLGDLIQGEIGELMEKLFAEHGLDVNGIRTGTKTNNSASA